MKEIKVMEPQPQYNVQQFIALAFWCFCRRVESVLLLWREDLKSWKIFLNTILYKASWNVLQK